VEQISFQLILKLTHCARLTTHEISQGAMTFVDPALVTAE
jgi:hypothetical protein